MATNLLKPSVRVKQTSIPTVSVSSPSALVPCIVGPSYQIVTPLTVDGALDEASRIIAPARMVGTDVVTEPAMVSGLKMLVQVNDGASIAIQFPTTIGDVGISHVLVLKTLNRVLLTAGAFAAFEDGVLVLETKSGGSALSIALQATDDSAYSALKLPTVAGTRVTGADGYQNVAANMTFSSLPATKTATTNLKWTEGGLALYRYYNNRLTALSKTSAIARTSYSLGASTLRDSDTVTAVGYQPLTTSALSADGAPLQGGRTFLRTPKAGVLSNLVNSEGSAASVTIPLGHLLAGATKFPDPTGANFLYVRTHTLSECLADATLDPSCVGNVGNTVYITWASHSSTPACSFDNGTKVLTLTVVVGTKIGDGTGPATADLKTLINSTAASWAPYLSIAVSGNKDAYVLGEVGTTLLSSALYLVGGEDPTNFVAEAGGADRLAHVTGAVDINVSTTTLGLVGKRLYMSVNGCPWIEHVITSAAIETQLEDKLVATFGGGSGYAVKQTLHTQDAHSSVTTEYHALQLVANVPDTHAWYRLYQDSTIQVWSDDATVVPALFSGGATRTSPAAALPSPTNNRSCSIAATDYNVAAATAFEKVLVPNNLSLQLTSVEMPATLVCLPPSVLDADWLAVTGTTLFLEANGTPVNTGAMRLATYADFITAVAGLSGIRVTKLALNGHADCLAISSTAGTLKLTSATDSSLLAALGILGNTAIVDATVSPGTATVTIGDGGTDNAGQVTAISNGLGNVVFQSDIGFTSALASHLTAYLFNQHADAGSAAIGVDHSTGALSIALTGDMTGTKVGGVARLVSGTRMTVGWQQYWPNCVGPQPLDYSRVFHGPACSIQAGDVLHNGTGAVGTIMKARDLLVGSRTFTNAQLVLSEASAKGYLYDWYVVATGLDVQTRNIAPELAIDILTSQLTLKSALNRSTAGIAGGTAVGRLYAGYRALRTDVTAVAGKPSILTFADETEVEKFIGPIQPDNPLAFGMSMALGAMVNTQVVGLGVDSVSADAPYGTPEAYDRAFEVLERYEIHTLAVMTFDQQVGINAAKHCNAMSDLDGKLERRALLAIEVPTEEAPYGVLSDVMQLGEESPALSGRFTLTLAAHDIVSELNGKTTATGRILAISSGTELTAEDGVWLDRPGDAYRYLVTKIVDQSTIQIDTLQYPFSPEQGPGTGGNGDSYYKEDASALASFAVSGEECTVNIRQAAILLTSTAGKNKAIAAIASYATQQSTKSALVTLAPSVGVDAAGTVLAVEGFYASAAWAGMSAYQPVKQGFTNFPIPGLLAVYGTSDTFTDAQMAAAGGINWLIQDGTIVKSRFQLTTDTSSLETREWSIIRQLDLIAKSVRAILNKYLGVYTSDDATLQQASMELSALAGQLSGTAAARVSVTAIAASKDSPDKLAATVTVRPWYAINGIDITVVAGNV